MNGVTTQHNKNGSMKRSSDRIGWLAFDMHTLFLLVLVVFIFVLMSVAMPTQFPTTINLESMAFQMSEVGILTVAMALSMLIGGIDLSVTATANLSAITAGLIMVNLVQPGLSAAQLLLVVVLALLAAIAVGVACGLSNGVLIGFVGVPAILATLGTLTLFTGLAYGVTGGPALHGVPPQVLFLGIGKFIGIPLPLLIFLAVLAAISLTLNHTAYGFKVYLLGSNPTAARFSGIDNPRITLQTHMIGGLLSAIAGIVTLARTNSANADYGSSYILMTILIAVLGGVAVSGGYGRVAGLTLALMVLQMLSTGFNMLLLRFSGSNFFRDFAWGFLLLFVMVFTRFLKQSGTRALWKQILSGK